jgi:hypothetical protein
MNIEHFSNSIHEGAEDRNLMRMALWKQYSPTHPCPSGGGDVQEYIDKRGFERLGKVGRGVV